ncbi:30S ribosomal protein S4 [Candidatus Woesearchaeota archaeon]|nr:30S ribosomal protein S4 [Candidatus Woesearchaeota archaeon]
MGDPKKPKKTYSTPVHPWQKARIEEEQGLVKEYGLKNKQEIWRANSVLKKIKGQAKRLAAGNDAQTAKEKEQLLQRLQKLGLIEAGHDLSSVLGLDTKDILERRLQTVVYRKSLANSIKQARQMITHHHVSVGPHTVSQPGVLVAKGREADVRFDEDSSFAKDEHPERQVIIRKIEAEKLKHIGEQKANEKKADEKAEKKAEEKKPEPRAKKNRPVKEAKKISKEAEVE